MKEEEEEEIERERERELVNAFICSRRKEEGDIADFV